MLCRFEEIWKKDKKVDENFVPRSFYLKIFEENIDSKNLKCLINDIFSWNWLKACAAGTLELGLDLEDR